MATKKHTHRGKVLQQAVSSSGIPIREVVRRLKLSHTSYYRHIDKPDLDYQILESYGKVIKHDFSIEFPEMDPNNYLDNLANFKKPRTLDEAQEQTDYWRKKYIQILEKYNRLLEK